MRKNQYNGVNALPETYDALFEKAAKSSFFLSKSWFLNFEETVLGGNQQSIIYTAESGDAVAILPIVKAAKVDAVFPPKLLRSMTNYYSCYFQPILSCRLEDSKQILACLAESLWETRRQWDVLDLSALPVDSPIFSLLTDAFRAQGLFVKPYFCFGNWHHYVAGQNYDEYFNALPAVLRKNIPYNLRKAEKRHRLRIDVHTDASNLDRALADYEKLYLARWNSAEPYPDFVPGLAYLAAQRGALRLGLLYIDDEPAAAQLWLVEHGIASIFKVAFDRHFSTLSVGSILTAHMMKLAIDNDKVAEIDYLSGDDNYKKEWMTARRERWGVMVFNPRSLRGLAAAFRHIVGPHIKDWLYKALNYLRLARIYLGTLDSKLK